jgi:urease accessory protein
MRLCLQVSDEGGASQMLLRLEVTVSCHSFFFKHRHLTAERIRAIETGGCPHAAIREDISANLGALESLQAQLDPQILLLESGGDNLAANYSRELADYIIYVIDGSSN